MLGTWQPPPRLPQSIVLHLPTRDAHLASSPPHSAGRGSRRGVAIVVAQLRWPLWAHSCSFLSLLIGVNLILVRVSTAEVRAGATQKQKSSPQPLTPTPCTVLKSTQWEVFFLYRDLINEFESACGFFFFFFFFERHMLLKAHLSKWFILFFSTSDMYFLTMFYFAILVSAFCLFSSLLLNVYNK